MGLTLFMERGMTDDEIDKLRNRSTTMNDETRAAAERLREYLDAGGEFQEGPEPFGETYEIRGEWRNKHSQEDLWTLARAYLANPPRELKPLVWEYIDGGRFARCLSPIGRFEISQAYTFGGWVWTVRCDSRSIGRCESLEDGKPIAWEYYRRRVDELYV
jgi:hypothetical protein